MSVSTKNYIGAGMAAVALFLFWTYDFATYRQIPFYDEAIDKRQQLVEERRAILEKIQSLDREYQQRAENIKQFALIVPTKKNIEEIIFALDVIAIQSGLFMDKLTVQTDEPKQLSELNLVFISLEGSGIYPAILNFLGNIEQHWRIVDVDELDITRPAGSQENLTVKLKASAYFLK
jgi:Tfp pilus assembly protein PilO